MYYYVYNNFCVKTFITYKIYWPWLPELCNDLDVQNGSEVFYLECLELMRYSNRAVK